MRWHLGDCVIHEPNMMRIVVSAKSFGASVSRITRICVTALRVLIMEVAEMLKPTTGTAMRMAVHAISLVSESARILLNLVGSPD